MKPTKNNLRDELIYRLSLLNEGLETGESDLQKFILLNEISIYEEFLNLIDCFGDRIGYQQFENSNYTPILDYETKEPLKIGDKVKSGNSTANGFLHFDDYTKKYCIKTEFGQHHYTTAFIKIDSNYEYSIDNSKVECRPSHAINSKKW